ncbi:MAG: Redoxin domain protein [Planctomycetaceae bacterium]|nr:Redoxin domain protein [Planctomycetaceae bacterium]
MSAVESANSVKSPSSFGRYWLVAAVLPLLAGCPQSPPAAAPSTKSPAASSNSESQPKPLAEMPDESDKVPAGRVELQVVDLKGYENAVARQLGKVVLVDFWATWCAPCRQQFPHAIQLQTKFQDQGLTVMSVSVDQMDAGENLDELKARVLDFLKGQKATIPNLLVPVTDLAAGDPGAIDVIASRFDIDGGAIPHFKLYDRKGTLHRKFVVDLETGESFAPKDIDAAIEKLLAE